MKRLSEFITRKKTSTFLRLREYVWRCQVCARTVDVRHVDPSVTQWCHDQLMQCVSARTDAESNRQFERIEDEAAAEAAEGGSRA